jgi:hypothetical protein
MQPEFVNRSALHKVIVQGRREFLGGCFHFASTPQGHLYWEKLNDPSVPLPDEAIDYLRGLKDGDIPEMDN